MDLPDDVRALLDAPNYVHLATLRRDGFASLDADDAGTWLAFARDQGGDREAGAPVSRPSYQVGTVYPCPALARPTLSRFGNRRSGLSAFQDQSENYAG